MSKMVTMNELTKGDVFIVNGTELVFVDRNPRSRKYPINAIRVRDKARLKANYSNVELTGEKRMDLVSELIVAQMDRKRKILEIETQLRNMEEGTGFIGNDKNEYFFKKVNRTKFVMQDKNGREYDAPFRFFIKLSGNKKELFDNEKYIRLTEVANPFAKFTTSKLDYETYVNQLASEWVESCGLHNEGEMATLNVKVTDREDALVFRVYNDGFCCLVMNGATIAAKIKLSH